jgi:hypothetical protein
MLRAIRAEEVSAGDGIALCDLRKRGDSFRPTMEAALRIIKEQDSRRYARVARYIHRVVNAVSNCGLQGRYFFETRMFMLEFRDGVTGISDDALAAFYACVLVHESTHGVLAARRIGYSGKNRPRIERLCVTEQNRFAVRLATTDPARYPIDLLHIDFDETDWRQSWNTGRLKSGFSLVWRAFKDKKAEPAGPPNGGPGARFDRSGVSEGPPSVS